MFGNKYTTLWWIYLWGGLTIVLATIGEWAGEWTWIAVWITFAILVIVTSIRISKYYRRRRLLKDPMIVTYLIPQRQYPRKQFVGAPLEQDKPTNLIIGVGSYQIFIEHTSKVTLTPSYPPYIGLVGVENSKPTLFPLKRHPFIVEESRDAIGNILRTDWHGITVTIDPKQIGEKQYVANTAGLIARGIHTFDNWKGNILITWCVKETDKPIVTNLNLEVSKAEGADQISFLKLADK